MKRMLAALFLSSLGSFAFAEGSSYALEVDVAPDGSGRANAYLCHVVVRDLERSEIVMAPQMAFLSDTDGPAGVVSTKDGDTEYAFSIGVDSKASRTTAELKVTRAGKLVAEQKTSMSFHR